MRSDGSRALGAVDATQKQIGARIGVSRATVAMWIRGDRVPDEGHRRALRAAFGIHPEAWPDTTCAVSLRRLVREAHEVQAEIVAELAERWPDALEAVAARLARRE
jgi:transcriptional regulator with XRE-family HTH domain